MTVRTISRQSSDSTKPLADALRVAGFRVKTFVRQGNPLDFDCSVRPVRTGGMCEALARTFDSPRAWVWVECHEQDLPRVHEIATSVGQRFTSVGYPRA